MIVEVRVLINKCDTTVGILKIRYLVLSRRAGLRDYKSLSLCTLYLEYVIHNYEDLINLRCLQTTGRIFYF